MVSDNTAIFTREEFAQLCKEAGIFQKFCAAGHPGKNGLMEHNVQMLKHRLATMSNQNMLIHQKVREILFRYQVTPLSNGKHIDQLQSTEVLLPMRKTVHFDLQPKSPMSDDRKLNKLNLGDLTEIMDTDVVLPETAQQECLQQEHRLPAYLRDYSL
ncbi:hypothetical protein PR048_033093 [Dryococelus australis]|uniref:Integrase catalytic domain-containing protein n=1 Tax=Dryococelus australis TaxID=614101 RepID=A0ABQ9G2L3_9NEOP|nr:hypothetical protein PR048_033093 [Dryococelus australis]